MNRKRWALLLIGVAALPALDTRGRPETLGSFRLGESYGEFQPVQTIDWNGPRIEREAAMRDRTAGVKYSVVRAGPTSPQLLSRLGNMRFHI